MGAFGFAAHPEAGSNFAVLDWVAALRWVAANSTASGGDPDTVTVFGQSAGAAAVRTLLSVPGAPSSRARGSRTTRWWPPRRPSGSLGTARRFSTGWVAGTSMSCASCPRKPFARHPWPSPGSCRPRVRCTRRRTSSGTRPATTTSWPRTCRNGRRTWPSSSARPRTRRGSSTARLGSTASRTSTRRTSTPRGRWRRWPES
ncbi:carboxylesterase family protein [Amycolatopsis sp. H20-H5]|uniref:carboxylesterase family protein n=1 Tax=Amycolatopsis sp. H20-H5 TaxID=3046309 RepID=UPI002DBACF49|nr:carboxylesterase family protein [Amycolatopsis sp. H20-H5]MEC3974443.1 carboxylesterase family protein [Amycolatopsis sp. H20-H5]